MSYHIQFTPFGSEYLFQMSVCGGQDTYLRFPATSERTRAQCRKQEIVRTRSGVCTADINRLVTSRLVRTDSNILGKTVGSAVNNNVRCGAGIPLN